MEEILKEIFKIELRITHRWDKNNWVSLVDIATLETKKYPRKLRMKVLPDRLVYLFQGSGFKIIKFHNSKRFHPGLWTTSTAAKHNHTVMILMVGRISEESKWSLYI